eukprot:TRINITY_DN47103_c0_g1_i1.p1 TRINITY_DN47103_c0_g1~~TRINITY_DN47103_c0_g1_i1.p1  ORF type:complete len:357 (+),score=57.68 TRINITY_DN47103_c0_g1_i1:139-1209(+)
MVDVGAAGLDGSGIEEKWSSRSQELRSELSGGSLSPPRRRPPSGGAAAMAADEYGMPMPTPSYSSTAPALEWSPACAENGHADAAEPSNGAAEFAAWGDFKLTSQEPTSPLSSAPSLDAQRKLSAASSGGSSALPIGRAGSGRCEEFGGVFSSSPSNGASHTQGNGNGASPLDEWPSTSISVPALEEQELSDSLELAPDVPELASAMRYLGTFGYPVGNASAWRQSLLPKARIRVTTHEEVLGHTWYTVDCEITPPHAQAQVLRWSTSHRLKFLRESIYSAVKSGLGKDYPTHFGATPFAHRMAPPGTTARLDAWFQTLSKCLNAGLLGPLLTAHALRELNAPAGSVQTYRQASDG